MHCATSAFRQLAYNMYELISTRRKKSTRNALMAKPIVDISRIAALRASV